MDKLLYFPYISIPDTEWTIQSLLYWDKVASIIPFEFMQDPEQLSDFTKILLREELLTQIYPEEHTYQIKNFTSNFIKYVNNELQKNIIPVSHDLNYFCGHFNRYQKIHMVKMEDIGEELIELGLAFRDDRWYYVEKSIAKAFMTYLAILLAKRTDHVASADRFNGLSSLLDQHIHNPYKVYNESRNKLRIQILKDILPVPHQINDVK